MAKRIAWAGLMFVSLGWTSAAAAPMVESEGNTDGVLTWRWASLAPGQSVREVVLFAYDNSLEEIVERLEKASRLFADLPAATGTSGGRSDAEVVWIRNETTDFALAGPGHFFWEGLRQGLTGPAGGQISRFAYCVQYTDQTRRRAGASITNRGEYDLRVLSPIQAIDSRHAAGLVETADRMLRIRIRAMMGDGPVAGVEFAATNIGERELGEVCLSVYSNLESAHTHNDDYSLLDRRIRGVLVVDPVTGVCVTMAAGLDAPATGHSGTWPSQSEFEAAAGVPFDKWPRFTAVPKELKRRIAEQAAMRMPHAPAPPVEPTGPPSRDLSEAEAEELLARDWLFQADDRPTLDRSLREIEWARQLAARLSRGSRPPDLSEELGDLDRLTERILEAKRAAGKIERPPKSAGKKASDDFPGGVGDAEIYFEVRRVKRRITFKNPAVDFSQVLFIDNPYPQGAEWPHQARHRNGMMAVPGGRLLVLDGLYPGGRVRELAPQEPGSFWRPDLSFDADRVLFCYKAHDEPSFHLYEMGLDGAGLRQLTTGPYDDIDPIYLPSGHILFCTTRCNTYVRCMPYTYSYVLARCDSDGRNIYLLSRNNEPDWCPALLADGRVIYSRWEYHDKALWRIQSLWTMNPDGAATAAFWGNQSVWPDHLAEPRPIPGSNRVMFTGLAHHDWFAGSIGIIDPSKGFNFPDGLTKVTADVPWPECGTPPVDSPEAADYHISGDYAAYKSPFPLSEEDFLVSARRSDGGQQTSGREKFRLYLMDVYGNRELIYEGQHNVWHALPVRPRPKPRLVPDQVAWPAGGESRKAPDHGVLFSTDVYEGVPELTRGMVKYLRVIQMDARTYSTWTRDGRFSGPVVSAIQDDGVKRILGVVPVASDGSVAFQAPAGKALHFQLLDEEYRALHTMRSFTGVMPGERRGCVGCHEIHSVAPIHSAASALRESPAKLTPPAWGLASISYERLVQPVLDRYCVQCHRDNEEGREAIDLTLRPGRGVFKEPYLTLVGYANFSRDLTDPQNPGIAGALKAENYDKSDPESYRTSRPLQHLSYTSRLIELASSGEHYGVQVDLASLRQLIGWVDANCPYRGDQEIRELPDPDFPGIERLPIRPKTRTAPEIPRP